MKPPQRREHLREELRPIIESFLGDSLGTVGTYAAIESVTDAVHPLVRAAYENGKNAAQSREGWRLVKENERLRHGMRELRESVELYGDSATVKAFHAALDDYMDRDKE